MNAEQQIYAWFAARGFRLESVEHDATRTVADAAAIKLELPEGHSKSLLVTEKDGTLTLIVVRGLIRADLKTASKALGAKRFSFAKEDEMVSALGVRPGSLTPLALINDKVRRIGRVVIDEPLMTFDQIWCHPLRNTASIGVSPEALTEFIMAHHGAPIFLDLEGADPRG